MDRKSKYSVRKTRLSVFPTFVLIFILFLITKPVFSQVGNAGEILKSGTEDAEVLLQEYLKPFGSGFGADMNTGWFTAARPLRPFGFDLRVSVSASFVPVYDRSFDVTSLNLNTVKLLRGPSQTPTVFGDDTDTSTLGTTEFNSSTQQEEEIFSFNMPKGSGYHVVPAPMAQFTLGLPGHTQATLRYSPELVIDNDYSVRVFGIGGLIGLNQLLFNDQLPIDLSLQAGIMDLSANAKFNVLPPDDDNIENQFPDSQWEGQGINFDTNTFTANVIVGKRFSILSFFGGVGYQYASTNITTEGPYPVVVPIHENDSGSSYEIQSITVPINISVDGTNDVHAVGGLRLNLGLLSISTSYTVAKYSTLKAGVGIIIRS